VAFYPRLTASAAAPTLGVAARAREVNIHGLTGLGGLPPGVEAGLNKLAVDLGQSCIDAWKAVDQGVVSRAWQYVVGSESSAAAGRSAANSQCNLAKVVKERVDKIIAAGDTTAAQQLLVEAEAGHWTDISTIREAMNLISASGGANAVVVQSVKDAGSLVLAQGEAWKNVFKYLPYIAAGVGALAVLFYGGKLVKLATSAAGVSGPPSRRRRRTRPRRH
jgi:hypothetical protein